MQRRQLETAAANYTYLRGLFFIPLGGLFVLAALGNWQVGPLRHSWVFVLVAVVLGLAYLPISRYYNENYGRLTPSTRQQVLVAVGGAIGAAVVFGGSLLLRSRAGWSLDLPVNPIAITFAVVMLITYGVGVGLRAYHVIIWGTVLVAGALPVWNGADPGNIALVLAGAATMVSGVFDHRLFVQTFGPPHAVDYENGDVAA
jgi:hypothetical protein